MKELSKKAFLADKYFSTTGRINRSDYLLRISAIIVFLCSFAGINALIISGARNHGGMLLLMSLLGNVVLILFIVCVLATGYALFCVTAQRLHDIGHKTYFGFAVFIPFLYFFYLFLLYLACRPGCGQSNVYGSVPLKPSTGKITTAVVALVGSFCLLSCVGSWVKILMKTYP